MQSRTSQTTELAEHAFRARTTYESAAASAVVTLLWLGEVVGFAESFPRPIGSLLVVSGGFAILSFAYYLRTWRRPNSSAAVTLSLIQIGTAAIVILWGEWAAPSGRTWEPVAAAQLMIASMPLVAPPVLWVGVVLVVVFSAVLTAVVLYPQYAGLAPIPAGEPYVSLTLAVVALVVLWMREQRRRLGVTYIRTQSEASALARLCPLFASVRDQLNQRLSALRDLLNELGHENVAMNRAVGRLTTLSGRIDDLEIDDSRDQSATPFVFGKPPAAPDAERLLLARDSELGATIYAVAAAGTNALTLWAIRSLPLGSTSVVLWCAELLYAAIFVWLVATWHRPTVRRGVLASLFLFSVGVFDTVYMHVHWVSLGPPAFPFVGYKLGIVALVVLRPVRIGLGLVWLAAFTLLAVTLHFGLASVTQHPTPLEPWRTLLFTAIAAGLFVMSEQRRVASLELLRTEVEGASLRRQVNLFLALRDEMNTPLQTLVLVAESPRFSATEAAELRSRIDRLNEVQLQLKELDTQVPNDLRRESLDAAAELRRH